MEPMNTTNTKAYIIIKLIRAIIIVAFTVSSLISAYHGNMPVAIYTALWAMWFELLGAIKGK
jgi:hypothetical protein